MVFVDSEICRRACPFGDKINGICSRALVMRRPKSEVCISTVSIQVETEE